jgi:uncharacterized protein YjbJ (UPF0337 family)
MNNDQIKGKAKDVAGRVERQVGEWTGSEKAQAEGVVKQAEGKVQNAWGNVKDEANKLTDKAKNKMDRTTEASDNSVETEEDIHSRRKAS